MVPFRKQIVKCYLKSIGYGGGGGNRTRVRKSSAVSSTCIAWSIEFNRTNSDWQDVVRRFPEFRDLMRDK